MSSLVRIRPPRILLPAPMLRFLFRLAGLVIPARRRLGACPDLLMMDLAAEPRRAPDEDRGDEADAGGRDGDTPRRHPAALGQHETRQPEQASDLDREKRGEGGAFVPLDQ